MPLELPTAMTDQTELALKLFGMLILRSHLEIPREVLMKKGALLGARVPRELSTIYQPRETYRGIARMLRISESTADDAQPICLNVCGSKLLALEITNEVFISV